MLINNYSQYSTYKAPAQKVNFGGLLHVDPRTGNINDSWFNRDRETLKIAAGEIKTNFPNGADVLIYGCSTGEENISFNMLLPDSRYRTIGYDTSADALRIGKRGVYTVFSGWYDSYLLPCVSKSQMKQHYPTEYQELLQLREKFRDMMYEVPACKEYKDINNKSAFMNLKYTNPNFVEKFYHLKKEHQSQMDLRLGNFMNVGQVRKERPVGGIFFRNGIYHLFNNNINEIFDYNAPAGIFRNKSLFMEHLINGVYKTLDDGGIFVLGNHIKEHLFLADETTPKENIVNFCDTPFFVESNEKHQKHKFLKCYKESPLLQALLKDGRFEPIGFSDVTTYHCKVKVPVIFRKVRI